MVKDIFEDKFKEDGIKSPFNDFILLTKTLALDDERIINKVYSCYNGILNLILILNKLQNDKNDRIDTTDVYIIRALHESLCMNFHSAIKISLLFLNKYTEEETDNFDSVLKYISLVHELQENEEFYLSLTWFNEIELILTGLLNNKETLKVFGGRGDTIQFQLYDDESEPIIKASPFVMNEQSLISSGMYFSLQFLTLITYFDLVMRYICIEHWALLDYEDILALKTIKAFKDENINIDNYEDIHQFYETMMDSIEY